MLDIILQIAHCVNLVLVPCLLFYLIRRRFEPNVYGPPTAGDVILGSSLTDRMTTEARSDRIVRQAVQSMGMSCLVLDDELQIVDANQSFCNKLGYTSPDLVGNDIQRLLPPATRATNVSALRRLLIRSGFLEPCTLTVLDNRENVVTLPVLLSRARFDDAWYLCLFVVMPDMLDRLCDLRDTRDANSTVCHLGDAAPASLISP